MNLRTFRIGGVHPEENKITAEMATHLWLYDATRFLFLLVLAQEWDIVAPAR